MPHVTLRRSLRHALLMLAAIAALIGPVSGAGAQTMAASEDDADNVVVAPQMFDDLRYRSLNFTRGGRSTAVAGVATDPLTYYFGGSGSGVWKTADAGMSWNNVTDGFIGVGSIGAITVAPSDPNVVYLGTGSACPRGNVSIGDGLYRTTDAGKTWEKVLPLTALVGKIEVDPRDHDRVYAAVVGNIFGPGEERGVYRSTDGGDNWEKVLYIDENTGAVDIELDQNNPRIMLASIWSAERKPWTIDSGSEDDGIYRSKDGGTTWERLSNGLPDSTMGKTSVAISPANGDRMWALIEATDDQGGVYRSDDGGDSWRRINSARNLQQRAWYYIHIYADPVDEDTVYALNTGFYKSTDGGRTFDTQIRVPHGDNHDLWINPNDPGVMVNANDGGANVSFNGGGSWSHQRNQPTAEIYRLTVDTRHPYRVYGAQQDNSTASVSSQGGGFGFGGGFGAEFYSVGGGESGHIAVDPRYPNIVYAGSYGGTISRMDTDTRVSENIRAYPESQTGQQALDMTYRFQWNAPIRISPHDPDVVYHTSQFVHRTSDGGRSWETISPDLTRNDPETQGYSGGPITRDNTGVEVYNTIFAFEESPHAPGLFWTGTDDGRVWISRDTGANWEEITPDDMPPGGTVNLIDVSAHDPGRAHMAVFKYRENDFRPYIFQTDDYGTSWRLLTDGTNGIPETHFVRTVREDPDRRGLLYAGTEHGMYVSFDDGDNWQSFQLNLPVVPITEIVVYRKDLVVATQGRAFWVLENLTPLHQIQDDMADRPVLFEPKLAYRGPGGGAEIDFYLPEGIEETVQLEILDADGEVVRAYSSRAERGEGPELPPGVSIDDVPPRFRAQLLGGGGRLQAEPGHTRMNWNLRGDALFRRPRGIVMWGGGGGGNAGPKVVPGSFQVRLTVGEESQTQPLIVEVDPRLDTTVAQLQEQYDLAHEVGGRVDELWTGLTDLRAVKQQIQGLGRRLGRDNMELVRTGRQISEQLTDIEGVITQLQGEGGQDALNFPGRLDNQWAVLYGSISGPDTPVTAGAKQRYEDLKPEMDVLMGRLDEIYAGALADLNAQIAELDLEAIPTPRGNGGDGQ